MILTKVRAYIFGSTTMNTKIWQFYAAPNILEKKFNMQVSVEYLDRSDI